MFMGMTAAKHADFFLEPAVQKSAARGEHNFLRLFSEVLTDAGFQPRYRNIRDTRALKDAARYNITFMKEPLGRHGIVFRRLYHYPFWQIEKTAKRWEWDVAKAGFDPTGIAENEATAFRNRWRRHLFNGASQTPGEGHVLVVLQGKLTRCRSFQSCSPIEMVQSVIDATEPEQTTVIVALHPKETYSTTELNALKSATSAHSRVSIITGGSESLLRGCRLVATQNSAVAFDGYFFDKPAVLFGRSEFHHVALQATPKTAANVFAQVKEHNPDYARYLFWFWQICAINAGRDEAKDRIYARLKRFDWPV